MMTKEQEWKELSKIQKILESLEKDSYVKTAFEGCIPAAVGNIENDSLCSPYQRAISAEKELERIREDNERHLDEKKSLICKQDEIIQKLRRENSALETVIDTHEKQCRKLENDLHNSQMGKVTLEEQVKGLELEIIKLKAKLYDLTNKD